MRAESKSGELDFSRFPPGTITEYTTLVCLACIFDIFTDQLGLAPRTAYSEIRRYAPTLDELTAPHAVRPFFDSDEKNPHCPYCKSSKRWHARLDTCRIEGIKATDALRRELMKSLPQKDDQFLILEVKSDKRKVFFDWLDTLVHNLALDENTWLVDASRAFLERSARKTDWEEVFAGVRSIRPSNRLLDRNWHREGSRLFVTPAIYNEILLVQYFVSRSQVHGGRTSAGRLTLTELIRRLRYSGYLSELGITEHEQFEVLEKVVQKLAGGTGVIKLYYLVDRRDFLSKVKFVYARYA